MQIRRLSCRQGAEAARGTAVIIDVFRAFSCEPLMFRAGAREIFLDADVAHCLATRGDALLVGECDEQPIDGFDLTNSPYLILQQGDALFGGRSVRHRTTSGVTGTLSALTHAEDVLLASFLTAEATARYILDRRPEIVSIVAMGIRSAVPAPEDERCGDYIESLLTGGRYDHVAAINEILAHESAQKFLRGDKPYLPKEDPAICLQRDLFPFTLRAMRRNGAVLSVPIAARASGRH
jgi:2-phosphosulfolactate phosphatase